MKRNAWKQALSLLLVSVAVLTMMVPVSAAAEPKTGFAAKIENRFADPAMEQRPAARWWLAEGLHTDETLRESIRELYDYGFGSLEFLTLDESAYLDDATYAWGSEEWVHDSQLIVEECTKLGMGVSFTSGTHWSTANLMSIDPDEEAAAQELGYRTLQVAAGQNYTGELPQASLTEYATKSRLVKVIAANVIGTTQGGQMQLEEESLTDVTDLAYEADGKWQITYTAPQGEDRVLFVFWQYGTSETYKPAVSNSYTINYYSKEGSNALIEYWKEKVLTPQLQEQIRKNGNVMLYMDSLEINPKGANTTGNLWCKDYLEEFQARRGYDVSRYLPVLVMSNYSFMLPKNYPYTLDSGEKLCEKIRNDLYLTNTELYMENCLDVLREWLHSFGMTLRAENSYGKELELSMPVKSLDYVETESYEFGGELDALRGQAGAAHLYDKIYSSETGANTSDNYVRDNNYYRQLFYTQYAAGVQKTVTHGYSSAYGPEEHCSWPGFEGMTASISERFNKRQPNALDYSKLWGEHISRLQSVLMQGEAQMDLGILRTDYQYYMMRMLVTPDYATNALRSHTGFYWQDTTLQDHGYTYDYFSPYLLQDPDVSCENGLVQADTVGYQALLVYQEELPYESAEVLYRWASDGLPVVIVDGPTTEHVQMFRYKQNKAAAITTGQNDGKDADLAALMEKIKKLDTVRTVSSQAEAYDALQELGVTPRAKFSEKNQKLLTVLRKADDAAYLYIYHYMYTDTENYTGEISLEGCYKPYVYDTWSNEASAIGEYVCADGRTRLPVELVPGEVMVIALDPEGVDEKTVVHTENVEKVVEENGVYTLFVSETGKTAVSYSDGTAYVQNIEVPEDITLDTWDLTVQSWEPGEKLVRTEDRGVGHVATEVSYATKKVDIPVGRTALLPWKSIAAVGDKVSGVGYYSTKFTLPENWTEENGLVFCADSFCGGTAALFVNGKQVNVNMDTCSADISAHVKTGENTLEVRVTSSLRNRMLDHNPSIWTWGAPSETAEYGMVGTVTLDAYTMVKGAVEVNLNGPAEVTLDDALEYTVAVTGAEALATATLSVAAEGLDDVTVTAAEGWTVFLQTEEDGVLTVVMGNMDGVNGDAAIATVTGTVDKVGEVSVAIDSITLSAYEGEGETFVNAIIGTGEIVTEVKYSVYDVNQDGTVNQLDITRAQRFFGKADDLADVDDSGEVDITDLVLILNNYS